MKIFHIMVSIIISLLLLGTAYAESSPLPIPVGRVVWVKGDSLKATMANKEVRLLQKQSIIYLHDVLTTNADTTAEIVFTDNTLMTFQPNTKFSIDQYSFSRQKKNNSVGKSVMQLIEGGFRTITGLIAKTNSSDYQVKTPIATIGVRGTDYAIYIKNGELYVAHYAGTPCVTSGISPASLCLDNKNPYARVKDANSTPESITTQPEGFRNKLDITQATVGFPESTSGSNATPRFRPGQGGTVSSFCIQ